MRPGLRTWSLVAPGAHCPLLEDIRTRPAAVMARGQVLKHDAVTTVVAVEDGSRQWVVKRYNTKNRWHAARRLVRTTRAFNCWRAAGWLAAAGIDTPAPVAVLEERPLGFLRGRSYLVCEWVEGRTLDRVLSRPGGASTRLFDQTVSIVARLRDNGIVHGDLKATNFLVADERLYLLDLDATRRGSGRRDPGHRQDLERFLRNWTGQPELMGAFEKKLGY